MKARFHMTVEQNILWAKRNLVDYIWKSARLEGVNVTFPETYTIYEQAKVADINIDSVVTILNLKHAWRVVLDSIGKPLDLDFICKVHGEVSRGEALAWGTLRTGKVGISGTDYIPPIPEEKAVTQGLNQILSIVEPTERAITLMLWGMKSQLFWDGNKRTSMLIANKVMIENGCGVLSVPIEEIEAFNVMLCDYYTNDTLAEAKEFVYGHCVDGVDVPPLTPEIAEGSLSERMAQAKAEADRFNGERDADRGHGCRRGDTER